MAQDDLPNNGLAAAMAIESAFKSVIADAEKSVVAIARYRLRDTIPIARRLGEDRNSRKTPPDPAVDLVPNEFGTGVIISPENDPGQRFILTAYHLLRERHQDLPVTEQTENRIFIRLSGRLGFYAEVYAADPRSDLAVIKIDPEQAGFELASFPPLKIGNADDVRKGQLVLSLGNPYAIARDGSASASWGFVSNISRRLQPIDRTRDPQETIHHFATLLHIDARLNLGTSGGAILGLDGKLLGITTSMAAIDGYEKSVGFAIPFDGGMRRIVKTLMEGHEVEYGFLGIEPETFPIPPKMQLDRPSAAKALHVFPNAPAARAGIRNGDVILEVNEKPVYDKYDLMREIALLSPGAIAKIRLLRGGRIRDERTASVSLGKWPVINEEEIVAPNDRYLWRGMSVDFPTARDKFIRNEVPLPDAVLVLKVIAGAPAEAASLQAGDLITHVNESPVQTPQGFQRATGQLDGPVTLRLLDGRRVIVRK